jgi:hypothetical protein
MLLSQFLAKSNAIFNRLTFILPESKNYLIDSKLPVIENRSVNNAKEYAVKFNEWVLTSSMEFEMHVSLPGQNYDLMMALTLTNGYPFIVFMEAKSADVKAVRGKNRQLDFKQYNRVKKAVEELKTMASEGGKKLSAASRALVAGNYAFIYVTTHAGLRNTPKANEKVYFMTEDEVQDLLGVTWDFYKCLRATRNRS